ncbi:MAG: DUF2298 domain-containing protein [Oscillospiraceae bacterium]|nr:DUF2298 domain-containing protein [Oscillospiraceae bacterium]
MTDSKKTAHKTIKPLPIILALLLPVYVFLFSYLFLGKNGYGDAMAFFIWWLTLFIFGLAALPLTSYLFSGFRTKGYGFSKTIGILFSSLFIWTFSYLGILPFSRLMVSVSILLLAVVCWGFPRLRKEALDNLSRPENVIEMIGSEALFASILLILCFIKGIFPEINGEEKFMDFAFLNALLRTESLPAPDPWLAGESINYYYYGQYIYAFITKLNGIKPGIAYVLSMCTGIAIAFSTACSLGKMVFEGAMKKGLRAPEGARFGAGILSGLAVCFFGNSHSFFYDEKNFGNKFLSFFEKLGANVGKTDAFFYPNSTRYIGHNPDLKLLDGAGNVLRQGDYTIHEFPFYSYLIGDLHAHVVSMMIVLLIIAALFVFVFRDTHADPVDALINLEDQTHFHKRFFDKVVAELKCLLKPEIIVTAALLGLCTMCNYWDFLIYFVFSSMALLVYHALSSRQFLSVSGVVVFLFQIALILGAYLTISSNAPVHVAVQILIFAVCVAGASLVPTALTRTGMGMSFLFSAAIFLSLPFQYRFEMISNAIGLVDIRTAAYQFFIVWFVHILFSVVLIILVVRDGFPTTPKKLKRKPDYVEQRDPKNFSNPVSKFLGTRNRADIFMCGMAVVGFLMLLAPEIIYVRDIYQGDYDRTNTMFKFAFAAFIMLSLVLGYTLFRVFSHTKRDGQRSYLCIILSIVLALLLFIPGHYTLLSLEQRTGKIEMKAYKGLDGTAALRTRVSPQLDPSLGTLLPYAEAIDYLNENVRGTHVICEAYGYSYTDHCVVSAYTGLPTIFGWLTHEWLWRFQGIVGEEGTLVQNPEKPDLWKDIINPRHLAVDTIYTSTDPQSIRGYLDKYQVEFIIVGALERSRYGTVNEEGVRSMGEIVFSTENLYIVKVS